MQNYSDIQNYPAVVNPNPFKDSKKQPSFIIENRPEFFTIVQNASDISVDLYSQGGIVFIFNGRLKPHHLLQETLGWLPYILFF